ncbi:hypothetical protein R5R35_005172 [Gryllus longicercus]|uniref:C-type lectin domain-containing protein n=1 Tax=Gryllus longicercus TaxID=2509291 RepID=A0AAN9V194_9ORTH
MASARALAVAAVLALAAAGRVAAAAVPTGRQTLSCVCTSTHFADVSFAVTCERNSTGRWDGTDSSPLSKFFEQSSVSCSRGPVPNPGKDYRLVKNLGYYKFHPRQTTWEDALRTCASEGANLLVVNSENEANAVSKIFAEFPKLHEEDWLNDQVWVGISDLKKEGKFVSLTGRTLQEEGYERWANGEPNNEGGNEHCLAFDRQRLYNDEPCDTRLSFVCERRN